jgi:PAS domain-containing protein
MVEDRIVEYFPNWVLWLAIAGFFYWRLDRKIEWVLSALRNEPRENLALFADWQKREREAEASGEVFDRSDHRSSFITGIGSYRNPYDDLIGNIGDVKPPVDAGEAEKLLRTLIDHSVNGIARLRRLTVGDPGESELRCIYANEAFSRLLGIGSEEPINDSGEQIISIATNGMDSSAVENIQSQFARVVETGESIDVELSHTSGNSTKWLRLIGESVGHDVSLTLVDISDGKAKEERTNLEIKTLKERIRKLERKL